MTEKEIEDKIENNICLRCGKPTNNKIFCEDCYKQAEEKAKNNELVNSWEDVLWLAFICKLFSYNPKDNDKN